MLLTSMQRLHNRKGPGIKKEHHEVLGKVKVEEGTKAKAKAKPGIRTNEANAKAKCKHVCLYVVRGTAN